MDLNRFEKIDGGFVEAITLMRQGKKVAASNKREYVIRGNEKIYYLNRKLPIESVNSYNDFVNLTWYIPKPFDVRQAMRDKPDDWVGAFGYKNEWFVVGFNMVDFRAVAIPYDAYKKNEVDGLMYPGAEELNSCIPIDEVPK